MSVKILDGRIVRDEIAQNLKSIIYNLKSKPKLVIIQVGDNSKSNAYINQKIKFGEKIGAIVELQKFPANVSGEILKSSIINLNSSENVQGIIIQLPISQHLDKDALIETIDPKKDVDGLTMTNQKLLEEMPSSVILGSETTPESASGQAPIESGQTRMTKFYGYIPATAKGVISILNYYKIPIKGKKVTVVGRSKLVGSPMAALFRNLDAEVTVCHSQTLDLKQETRNADIIIVAVGKPNLITKEHVSPNQIVIDVGINVVNDHKPSTTNHQRSLVGDVNFAEVSPIVSAITPVPGGVGPMTVASLFENLLEAYKKQTA